MMRCQPLSQRNYGLWGRGKARQSGVSKKIEKNRLIFVIFACTGRRWGLYPVRQRDSGVQPGGHTDPALQSLDFNRRF
jgi:hypothetical protein